ncbi:arginyl-tRNA synthetase [Pleurotus eryngii]|uniref:arginine--tRNA ligase n=1 Tax=Pleurotus eryngii TaxID=5323 RepID=A0A9P5ZSF1_PLEER|nr:arginyl-tRNA synthetase [Pleurotus eryngii]
MVYTPNDPTMLHPYTNWPQRSTSPSPSFESSSSFDSERYDSDHTDCDTHPSPASSRTDLSDAGLDDPTLTLDAEKAKNEGGDSSPPALTVESPAGHLSNCRKFIATWLSASLCVDYFSVYAKVLFNKRGGDFILPLRSLGLGHLGPIESKILAGFPKNGLISSVAINNAFAIFTCCTSTLVSVVLTDIAASANYGFSDLGLGRKTIVEYSSPNIAKPFHIGHLRPTILGAFLRNLYLRAGWEVTAVNYLGDWGTQFAMIAVGFKKYGSDEALLRDPCKHLFEVYVNITKDAETDQNVKVQAAAFFKKMEDGDEEAIGIWKHWRKLTVARYGKDYKQLNAHFDVYAAESEVGQEWQDKSVEVLERLGHITPVEGSLAKVVDLTPWNLNKGVLRKGNGTSIYLSRDIAEAVRRSEEYSFDKMIYVVASQQDVHMARVIRILKLMKFTWADQCEHVNHGLVHGPKDATGRITKFSTRKGNVLPLDDAISQVKDAVHVLLRKDAQHYATIPDPDKVAEELAISLLKIADFSRRKIRNYGVDAENIESVVHKGDNGLLLQFVYARLVSLRRRNQHLLPVNPKDVDTNLLTGPLVHRLGFLLGKYPDIIRTTITTNEPCKVVNYCFELCHAITRLLNTAGTRGKESEATARARLFMFGCAEKVLKSAMELLTLRPQEWL